MVKEVFRRLLSSKAFLFIDETLVSYDPGELMMLNMKRRAEEVTDECEKERKKLQVAVPLENEQK